MDIGRLVKEIDWKLTSTLTALPIAGELFWSYVQGKQPFGDQCDAARIGLEAVVMAAVGTYFSCQVKSREDGLAAALGEIERQREEAASVQAAQVRQNEAEYLERLGNLVGGIAHHFNNRLTVVYGFADLLLRDLSDSGYKSSLDRILASTRSCADLIKGLSIFSGKGRPEVFDRTRLDLGETVSKTAKHLTACAGGNIIRNIRIEYKQSPHPIYVYGDGKKIRDMMLSLGLNAIAAMPNGGILSMRVAQACPDDPYLAKCGLAGEIAGTGYAKLCVSDTGTGIKPEHLPRIFDPFFTTKGIAQAVGMGLSNVYGIVRAHNGGIDVQTKVGAGTTFHIYLPLYDPSKQCRLPPQKIA